MLMLPAVIMTIESDEDRDLMTKIYLDHRALMYKVAWKYFRSKDDVDDIVSDSCREMIKHFSTISVLERNELRAYIVRIVRNTSYNLYRKKERERTVSLDDEACPMIADVASHDMLPENRVLLQETIDHTVQAIGKLSEREQDILFLRIMEKREYTEIAEMYGATPENIRKIVERVRKQIKLTVYGRKGI